MFLRVPLNEYGRELVDKPYVDVPTDQQTVDQFLKRFSVQAIERNDFQLIDCPWCEACSRCTQCLFRQALKKAVGKTRFNSEQICIPAISGLYDATEVLNLIQTGKIVCQEDIQALRNFRRRITWAVHDAELIVAVGAVVTM